MIRVSAANEPETADNGRTEARRTDRRKGESGFTLIELMVVIVIIGLLTTIVVINVIPSQDKARVEKAKTDIALIDQAVEQYRLDNLNYPTTSQGLDALLEAPTDLTNPTSYRPGGYIKRLPEDPWGKPYLYASPGKNGTYDIYSLGADGREGGENYDADIGNWR